MPCIATYSSLNNLYILFHIWFFILLILVFGYFLYSVTRKNKNPDTLKNDPLAITNDLKMALPENKINKKIRELKERPKGLTIEEQAKIFAVSKYISRIIIYA
jgi:hypothetical protein